MPKSRLIDKEADTDTAADGERFQDLFTGGSAIRAAPVDRAILDSCIDELNERFRLSVCVTDELYQLLSKNLPRVAGAFDGDTAPVNRNATRRRLKKLRAHTEEAVGLLRPVRLGLLDEEDANFGAFLTRMVTEEHRGIKPVEARWQLETALAVLERLDRYCERALVRLELTPAKVGRRSHEGWYDPFVSLVVHIATELGIEIRLPWDPSQAEQETPFTALAFAIERFLPRAAWSNSPGACAKRVERSLHSLGVRQKSSDP